MSRIQDCVGGLGGQGGVRKVVAGEKELRSLRSVGRFLTGRSNCINTVSLRGDFVIVIVVVRAGFELKSRRVSLAPTQPHPPLL